MNKRDFYTIFFTAFTIGLLVGLVVTYAIQKDSCNEYLQEYKDHLAKNSIFKVFNNDSEFNGVKIINTYTNNSPINDTNIT